MSDVADTAPQTTAILPQPREGTPLAIEWLGDTMVVLTGGLPRMVLSPADARALAAMMTTSLEIRADQSAHKDDIRRKVETARATLDYLEILGARWSVPSHDRRDAERLAAMCAMLEPLGPPHPAAIVQAIAFDSDRLAVLRADMAEQFTRMDALIAALIAPESAAPRTAPAPGEPSSGQT